MHARCSFRHLLPAFKKVCLPERLASVSMVRETDSRVAHEDAAHFGCELHVAMLDL